MKMEDKKTTKNAFACWSCKKPVTMCERADADGNCPHCDVELDVEDWPFPSGEPDAQPQGEPVAHLLLGETFYGTNGSEIGDFDIHYDHKACERLAKAFPGQQVALYAEQPAPVEITLNQVLAAYDYANSHPHKYLRGTTNWCAAVAHKLNACLDEVTRLSAKD